MKFTLGVVFVNFVNSGTREMRYRLLMVRRPKKILVEKRDT